MSIDSNQALIEVKKRLIAADNFQDFLREFRNELGDLASSADEPETLAVLRELIIRVEKVIGDNHAWGVFYTAL